MQNRKEHWNTGDLMRLGKKVTVSPQVVTLSYKLLTLEHYLSIFLANWWTILVAQSMNHVLRAFSSNPLCQAVADFSYSCMQIHFLHINSSEIRVLD